MSNSLAFDRAFATLGESRDSLAFDRITLRSFDVDGRLHVELCNLSKANVCPYFGREIPGFKELGLDPNGIYKLYRDPEELKKAAPTFCGLQLLLVHTPVNAKDPKIEVTTGCVGSDVEFIAPYLVGSLTVWTVEGIKLIESKRQAQLSCSYRYRADMTPGLTVEGVAFDGIMRDIMGNHVALVEEGRAGPDVYVSDSQPLELAKMKYPNLVKAVTAALAKSSISVSAETQLALDAEIEKIAKDADMDDEEEKKKKKAAEDAELGSKPVSPGPKEGERGAADAQIKLAIDSALASKGYVTKADADKLASDAANAAVARVNALHKAREDVKPLVGIVAFDSADEVYAFALKQSGVATDGVPAAAYAALTEQVKARKAAGVQAAISGTPKFATDAANAASAAIPGLGRFQVG